MMEGVPQILALPVVINSLRKGQLTQGFSDAEAEPLILILMVMDINLKETNLIQGNVGGSGLQMLIFLMMNINKEKVDLIQGIIKGAGLQRLILLVIPKIIFNQCPDRRSCIVMKDAKNTLDIPSVKKEHLLLETLAMIRVGMLEKMMYGIRNLVI